MIDRRTFITGAGAALTIPETALSEERYMERSGMNAYRAFDPERIAQELGSDIFTRTVSFVGVRLKCLVDVSTSIHENASVREYTLQKQGIGEAIRSDTVKNAIAAQGGIAFSLSEFHDYPLSRIPWAILETEEDADMMSSLIQAMPIFYDRLGTGIARGLRRALTDFQNCPHIGERSVLDISGDGPENKEGNTHIDAQGQHHYTGGEIIVLNAAQRLWQHGITCNGITLPTDPNTDLPNGINDISEYYETYIRTPAGQSFIDQYGYVSPLREGFVMAVNQWPDFKDAMQEKLRLEIMGQLPTPIRSFG